MKEVICLTDIENQTIGWLCLSIRETDDIEIQKMLSEELLKRNVNNWIVDRDAYEIALQHSDLITLTKLSYCNNNSCLVALVYQELENRVSRNSDKKMIYENVKKIKVKKRKRKIS